MLAYYPSDSVRDGKYRKVTVKVNRPDVRLMYRQGYLATDRLVPMDRREFVTSSRIDAAAQFARAIDHLKVTVGETAIEGTGTDRAATTRVTVDVSRVKFTRAARAGAERGRGFNSRVPIAGHARTLKVIVYDYGADLVGSAVAKIR